jgi:hypothetical protein
MLMGASDRIIAEDENDDGVVDGGGGIGACDVSFDDKAPRFFLGKGDSSCDKEARFLFMGTLLLPSSIMLPMMMLLGLMSREDDGCIDGILHNVCGSGPIGRWCC